jgi:hypothetical protein
MMHITMIHQFGGQGAKETTLRVDGETLILDGVPHDLSVIPDGGEGIDEGVFENNTNFPFHIRRIDGVIHVAVRVVTDETAYEFQPTDPAHWIVQNADGDVKIPAVRVNRNPEDRIPDGWFDGHMWHYPMPPDVKFPGRKEIGL